MNTCIQNTTLTRTVVPCAPANILAFILFAMMATPALAVNCACQYERWFFGVEYERQNTVAFDSISIGEGVPEVAKSFMKNLNNGYTFDFGYRFYDLGFRLGYTYSQEISYYPTLYASQNMAQMATGYLTQKSYNLFIDGLYYQKLAQRTELKFLLGVSGMGTTIDSTLYGTYSGYYTTKSFGPGFRIGAGAQYQLNNYLVVDFIVKCQAPANETFKYVVSYSFGLLVFM